METLEAAQGKIPGRAMRQHHAEFSLLKEPFLRHTSAMQKGKQLLEKSL